MHENYQRDEENVGSSDRSFGVVFTIFFAFLAGVKYWAGFESAAVWWASASAATFGVAMFVPSLLGPLNAVWSRFGLFLHKVLNPVILGAMFFFVFTPVGIGMRLFGWDALTRAKRPNATTYWITRDPAGPSPDSMKQQF